MNKPKSILPRVDEPDIDESYIRQQDVVVPNTCHEVKSETPNLDGTVEVRVKPCEGCDKGDVKKHDGVRCRVMDWEIGRPVLFVPPFEFKTIEEVS